MPVPCSEIIDDIEDLVLSLDVEPKQRYSSRKNVKIRAKKKEVEEFVKPKDCGDIPGTQIIYIKTWGCAHNSSDSEYMAGQLSAYGYKLTEDPLSADLWLLNSCTVKGPAEAHFRNEIERGQKLGKHIVTAGCVPQGAPKSDYLHGLSAIGVQNIDRVVEVVEETLKGHSVRLFGQKKIFGKKQGGANLMMPKIRKNPLIEIIPINTGCLNQCTYCKTKHARGELGSYPIQDIVDRAVAAFVEGVVELWLTSEDTGAYGRDIGETLPGLLYALVKVIPSGCRMRLGMTNPPYILEHLEAMAEILNHPRVYKFLHVPVQSGSDQVLADMKREYSSDDFRHVVKFLRSRVPGITIATDIICGFPTETDKDFELTMELCKEFRFPSLFINQFYPRPGTPAAKMERIPAQEVKQRTKLLSEFFQSYQPYETQKGREMEVLVTEVAHDGLHLVAHNEAYEQVLVPATPGRMGSLLRVRIVETKKHCLIGEVLSENNLRPQPPNSLMFSSKTILMLLFLTIVLKVSLLYYFK